MWRFLSILNNILLNSSYKDKYFRQKLHRKKKNTFYVQKLLTKKLCQLYDNMEKYGTARQVTNDNYNTAHTHFTVDK